MARLLGRVPLGHILTVPRYSDSWGISKRPVVRENRRSDPGGGDIRQVSKFITLYRIPLGWTRSLSAALIFDPPEYQS